MDKHDTITLFNVLITIALLMIAYSAAVIFKRFMLLKKQKARLAKLEEKKCKGAHKWLTMKVNGQSTHVCRECCYSPVHDGFVKDFYVEEAIFQEKYEQNYKKYFDQKIEELSSQYKIDVEILREIGEKIVKIKKDHASVYIQDLLKDLTQDAYNKSE